MHHNCFMKNEQNFSDEYFMTCAIKQAQKAFDKQEVPVGAVVVCDNKIIGSGYNKKEHKKCSIYHAEIVAIKNACKKKRDWRLNDCTLFVTMEPCAMCAGAIVNHRIKRVVIGVTEPNFGACGSGVDLLNNQNLNTQTQVEVGVLDEQCKTLLQNFFKARRSIKKWNDWLFWQKNILFK